MIYKYRVSYMANSIEKRQVIKETKHMVTYEEVGFFGKVGKGTEYKKSIDIEWFDTAQEACHAIIEKINKDIESLRNKISKKQRNLNKFREELLTLGVLR